jgi:hypothetical protein
VGHFLFPANYRASSDALTMLLCKDIRQKIAFSISAKGKGQRQKQLAVMFPASETNRLLGGTGFTLSRLCPPHGGVLQPYKFVMSRILNH